MLVKSFSVKFDMEDHKDSFSLHSTTSEMGRLITRIQDIDEDTVITLEKKEIINYIMMRVCAELLTSISISVKFVGNIPAIYRTYTLKNLSDLHVKNEQVCHWANEDYETDSWVDIEDLTRWFINIKVMKFYLSLENYAQITEVNYFLKDKECPVLHEPLTYEGTLVYSGCGHLLSQEAFRKMSGVKCPLCRQESQVFHANCSTDAFLKKIREKNLPKEE